MSFTVIDKVCWLIASYSVLCTVLQLIYAIKSYQHAADVAETELIRVAPPLQNDCREVLVLV